jgi:transposase-like protein
MTDFLKNPIFRDETKAREWVESQIWTNGKFCPHCGNADEGKIGALEGKAHRPGLWKCYACRAQFSCTVGTVFESSKIPLTKWVAALFLMTASKKGVSAHQVHRLIGVSYKSTWFMMHRLREAMRTGGLEPLGGAGKIVEVDETYYGKPAEFVASPNRRGLPYLKGNKRRNSRPVLALVERGGSVRTFHVAVADKATVAHIVRENVHHESRLMTDESNLYKGSDQHFKSHETVKHSINEYVRGDVTTNTVESYFSVFKRGMRGVYQHCAEKHLHRYLAEFDFRYNNRSSLGTDDGERAEQLAKGIVGKRLTYRRPREQDIPF